MTFTEFKRFADENNIVPVSTEIYSKMITDSVMLAKYKGALQEIRQEIEQMRNANPSYWNTCDVVDRTELLEIIDKHIKEIEG